MALSSFFLIIKKLEFLFVFKLYFRFKGHLVRKIKLPVHKINLKKFQQEDKGNQYNQDLPQLYMHYAHNRAFLVAQKVKNLPTMQKTQIQSLGQEDPLEKGKAIHFSILAWRIHVQRSLAGHGP